VERSYHGILFSSKKEQTTDSHNMDECYMHTSKKPAPKGYIHIHFFTYLFNKNVSGTELDARKMETSQSLYLLDKKDIKLTV